MTQFKVDYARMQQVAAAEEKAAQVLSSCADELMSSIGTIGAIGVSPDDLMSCADPIVAIGVSFAKHGYTGKCWNAYSNAANHQGYMLNLSRVLRSVHDRYMQCEKQVLQNADEDIQTKNGFTKAASKKAGSTAKAYGRQYAENQQNKKASMQEILYESTLANYKQMGKILDDFKEFRANGGKILVEKYYGGMEEAGIPAPVIGLIRKVEKKFGSVYKGYEDIFNAALHPTDPTALKDGIIGYFSAIDPTGGALSITKPMKTAGKLWNYAEDVFGSEAYTERGVELLNRFEECMREGDIGGAAATIGGGIAEGVKGTVDVGVRWTQSMIDKEILEKTTWVTGDIYTVDTINEAIASQIGINPGKVAQDIGAGIGDTVSSLMDGLYAMGR